MEKVDMKTVILESKELAAFSMIGMPK